MEMQQFEPMSTGQILDKTFRLYKSNFVRFLAVVAVIQVPLGLIAMLLQSVMLQSPGESAAVFALIGGLVLVFFAVVGRNLCNGALMKSVSESYLGKEATVSEAYRFVLPKLGTLIWASILVALIVAAGFILLIVPGVIFSLIYAITIPAIVLEGVKARQGMGRSRSLVKGNLGKVFAILFVVTVLGLIVGSVFGFVAQMLVTLTVEPTTSTAIVIKQVFSIASEVLVMPIGAAASILLYYDLRIRKEGFDLDMLAQSLGLETAAADEQAPIE